MRLEPTLSMNMASDLAHHVGLRRLFETHALIARHNPDAFDANVSLAGKVTDVNGDVSKAVEYLNIWFTGDEPSAVNNLQGNEDRIRAFVRAVGDIHRAAVINVGGLAEPGFGDEIIMRQVKQGLKLECLLG